MRRLLAPETVAVIGGAEAAAVVAQCDQLGFPGAVWPVHPTRTEIGGRRCHRSVADLPAAPDAAFVAVPREATIEVVAALAARGAGGAVCYASGFAESGPAGAARQAELLAAAGAMPLLGPNTYGLVNAPARVALWPDHHGCRTADRSAALVTQSSNIAMNLAMARPGPPISHVVAVGNQAGVTLTAAVAALLEEPSVVAIGLHVEWLPDGVEFGRVATEALDRGVALVALKTGRSETGAELNRSHTAALAGPDAAYDALFARYGVARVDTPAELAAALGVLVGAGPLRGNRVASLSCSGGEASLVADLGERAGLEFPEPAGAHRAAVAATLDDVVTVTNPLDYHTFGWGRREALAATFIAMLDGPYDAGLLVLDYPDASGGDGAAWRTAAAALADAAQATATPALVTASLPANLPAAVAEGIAASGAVPVAGLAEALAGLRAAAFVGAAANGRRPGAHVPAAAAPGRLLDEAESKECLSKAGVDVPYGLVTDAGGVVAAARSVGFPVALKRLGVAHKTEHGAVLLGLEDEAAVAAAAARLGADGALLLVEAMLDGAVAELNVGVTSVPGLGVLLTLAAGGTLVEMFRDAAHLLLPARREDLAPALERLRMWPLLAGFRGGPPGDTTAALDAVLAAAGLVVAGEVAEVEINPLAVFAEGIGAYALDARIVEAGS